MRAHHIVVAALILIGIGVKVTVVSTMTAEADSRAKSVDASQMQQNLPVEEFHDMTFVFPVRPGGN